jgi:hypothetical protein
MQEITKFLRIPLGQVLDTCRGFLNLNLFVLLFLSLRRETLPGQVASEEIHEHESHLFEVISAGLFDPQVRVKARVPCCTCELFIVFKRNVSPRAGVFVPLGQPKVDHIDDVLLLP